MPSVVVALVVVLVVVLVLALVLALVLPNVDLHLLQMINIAPPVDMPKMIPFVHELDGGMVLVFNVARLTTDLSTALRSKTSRLRTLANCHMAT